MDIIKELGNNDRYTFHTHTQFCDARADMEDFVKAAVSKGFTHLGFSPHSPLTTDVKYGEFGKVIGLPSCNMSFDSVPQYTQEIERLRKAYANIKIYRGMEIDYINDNWGPDSEYFKNLNLDFSIGSIHYIPAFDGRYVDIDGKYENFKAKMEKDFDGDIRYVVETFFRQSQAMIEKREFDIIGHFDKIKNNGGQYYPGLEDTSWYKEMVNDLIDSIIEKGIIVEINTKAWEKQRHLFPSQKHWERLIKNNVPVIVNSDAHYPELLNASRIETLHAFNYLKSKFN